MINVTQTFLPPIDEYQKLLVTAWDNKWITNRGKLVLELEEKLKKYLNVENIIITTNGTLPLQIGLKLLAEKGEVITTPFSYVATTAAILWEGCKPVFVDIHPDYFTIDETKIENAITCNTKAILATHVFGNPCNVDKINLIAKKYGLKVIYDAAHAFGVNYVGKPIFEYGDLSTCSFHATKLFHTGEGGAMFTNSKELLHQLYYSHNFGHNGPLDFYGLGINAKTSELQAAMGLAVLPYMKYILIERKRVVDNYDSKLNFLSLRKMRIRENTDWNYSYYPIVFESEETLLRTITALNNGNIFPRRYFYPSLNTLSFGNLCDMPVSESISKRILCLPLYPALSDDDIDRIVGIFKLTIKN